MKELKRLLSMNLAVIMLLGCLLPAPALALDGEEAPETAESMALPVEEEMLPEEEKLPAESEELPEEETASEVTLMEADDTSVASGMCGANVNWALYGNGDEPTTYTLFITGSGAMKDYSTAEAVPWYNYRSSIIAVEIGDNITSIGSYAFWGCDALTTIELPDSVTSINGGAFENCYALKSVDFGNGVTSIGSSAFYYCPKLTSIELSDSVKSIGSYAFYSCKGLETVDFGSSLTSIGSAAFCACSALTVVELPDSTESVDHSAFNHCVALETVTIGSGIKSIGEQAFLGCTALTSVTIDAYEAAVTLGSDVFPYSTTVAYRALTDDSVLGTWQSGSVTATLYGSGLLSITGSGEMANYGTNYFSGAYVTSAPWGSYSRGITAVEIGSGVTSVGQYAFYNCKNLSSVALPNSVTSISYGTFDSCTSLTTLNMGGKVTSWGGDAFYGCTNLTTVNVNEYEILCPDSYKNYLPASATVYYKQASGTEVISTWEIGTYDETDVRATLYADGTLTILGTGTFKTGAWVNSKPTKLVIGDGITAVPGSAFSGATKLTQVTLGKDIKSIEYGAFRNCHMLEEIALPAGLTSIGDSAFRSCTALQEIVIPNAVTSIGADVFRDCTSLENVSLSEKLSYINGSLFYGCTALREITIPDSVTSIEYSAFYNCTALETVTIGAGVKYIDTSAFSDCTALTTVNFNAMNCGDLSSNYATFANAGTLGEGITLNIGANVKRIPAYLFYTSSANAASAPKLKTITVADNAALTEIGAFAFYRCGNLTSADFGGALTTIGDGAFNTCSNLTEIRLPDTVKTVGKKAFFRTGLLTANVDSETATFDADVFGECPAALKIYGYGDSTVEAYAAANGLTFVPYAVSGTVTLEGNHEGVSYHKTVSKYEGKALDLLPYSKAAQAAYYAYASDENLVAWNTRADGEGTAYAPDASYTGSVNETLYAQWAARQKFSVSLAGNLPELTYSETLSAYRDEAIYLKNASIAVQNTYAQTGGEKQFAGWNTRADGTGKHFKPTARLAWDTLADGEMLYAQWEEYSVTASGASGALTWTLYENGRLTVTGTGAMPSYDDYKSYPWYSYRSSVQSIVIGDGVANIGNNAFRNCFDLQSVTIGDGVKEIGSWAFVDDQRMTALTIGNSVETIRNGAFDDCYALTDVTIPDSVKTIEVQAFDYCRNLGTVTIGNGIERIDDRAFYECSASLAVTINNYEVAVTTTDYSFSPTATVTYKTGDATTAVKTWEVGSVDESDVTATLYADGTLMIEGKGSFNQHPWPNKITSVVIGDGITEVPNSAFQGDQKLRSVTLGSDVERIEWGAFYGCTALESVALSPTLRNIGGYAFYNCTALAEIALPEGLEFIEYRAFYNCAALERITIPNSVCQISEYAFYNCTALEEVTVGTGLNWMNSRAFACCPNLQHVRWNAVWCSDLYNAGYYFGGSGTNDGFELIIGADVERIPAYLFYVSSNDSTSAHGLKSVRVEDNAALWEIGASAFYRCENLASVTLGDNLTTIGDAAFSTCTSLTEFIAPDSLVSIGRKAFYRSGLTRVTLWDAVEYIGAQAFALCPETLTVCGLPGSYAETYANENDLRFAVCTQSGTVGTLTWSFDAATGTLTLSGSGAVPAMEGDSPWSDLAGRIRDIAFDGNITGVGARAFAGCGVRDVVLPATLMTLDNTAFSGCAALRSLRFFGDLPQLVGSTNQPVAGSNVITAFYPNNNSSWNGAAWQNCMLTPSNNELYLLTLYGNCAQMPAAYEDSVCAYDQGLVELSRYSEAAQAAYYAYASDANLFAWNTHADGTGTTYAPDASVSLTQSLSLFAQWRNRWQEWPDFVRASVPSGNVLAGTTVTLSCANSAEIYYTLDGSWPTPESTRYTEAITLSTDTTIRAVAVLDGIFGNISTFTYTVLPAAAPVFRAETVRALRGRIVQVKIDLANNPGVSSLRLSVGYDSRALELIGVSDGGILGEALHADRLTAPYVLTWNNATSGGNLTVNGTAATLTFRVKNNAAVGQYPVTLTLLDAFNYDLDAVSFYTVNGAVNVDSIQIGDADGDGAVNSKDAIVLLRYLVEWPGYDELLDPLAADVDGDGEVTVADGVVLLRHLANWKGYETLGGGEEESWQEESIGAQYASYAYQELGVTTAYTLTMLGSDYYQSIVRDFTGAFRALGGTVFSEDFPEGSINFNAYVNNAISVSAGVIFAPVPENYVQRIRKATASQCFAGDLIGTNIREALLLATGGTSGTYYAVGGVMQNVLSDKLCYSRITVESTGGSKANLNMMTDGIAQLAIVQSDVLNYAHEGTFTFADTGAETSALWVAGLYDETIQIVAKPGINTVSDLRGKTVVVGDVGSGTEINARQILNAVGLTANDLTIYNGSFQDGFDALKNGTVDAVFTVAGAPTTSIVDYAATNTLNLVSLSAAELAMVTAEYPFLIQSNLAPGTYSGYDKEVVCVAIQAALVADETVSEDAAYELTRAIFENQYELTRGHAKWGLLSTETCLNNTAPLHPGAEKYYKEIGVL